MNDALTKIRKRAVAMAKEHPRMSYIDRIKKAGAEYRAGKISGRKPAAKRTVSGTKRISVVSGTKHVTRSKRVAKATRHKSNEARGTAILRKIDSLELKRKQAKGREAKNFIQALINAEHDKLDALRRRLKSA